MLLAFGPYVVHEQVFNTGAYLEVTLRIREFVEFVVWLTAVYSLLGGKVGGGGGIVTS